MGFYLFLGAGELEEGHCGAFKVSCPLFMGLRRRWKTVEALELKVGRLCLIVEGAVDSVPPTTSTTYLPDMGSDARKAVSKSPLSGLVSPKELLAVEVAKRLVELCFGLEDDNGAWCVSSSLSSLSSSRSPGVSMLCMTEANEQNWKAIRHTNFFGKAFILYSGL